MKNIIQQASELIEQGLPACLCIVTASRGSTPRKAGSKMIVFADGTIQGTIGGGAVEHKAIKDALQHMLQSEPMSIKYNLANDLDMHCGGEMEVYFEPLIPMPSLLIFGAGHVGKALARLAMQFGFRIIFFDNRPGIFDAFPLENCTLIGGEYDKLIDAYSFNTNSYIVVMTHMHAYDETLIAALAQKPHRYLGMIGSKRKTEIARKKFVEDYGLSTELVASIDMPIGLPIACETPEEIALSILAKIIDVKNTDSSRA